MSRTTTRGPSAWGGANEGAEGPIGPQGPQGDPGPVGPANLFIQQSAPSTSELVYQWWETDGAGGLVTLWVETNGA